MFWMRLLAALLLVATLVRGEETAPSPATDASSSSSSSSSGEKSGRGGGGASEHPYVTVRLWPRSQWDPEHTYQPARVVATMAVRVCERVKGNGECAEHRDAWSTAVSRDDYIYPSIGHLVRTLREVYHFADLEDPHLCELYRTYDNMTYTEIPLALDENMVMHGRVAPLHAEDDQLIRKVRTHAQLNNAAGVVLHLERGRMWEVPRGHWNAGERGLVGAHDFVKTEWIGHGEKDGSGHPNDETTNTDERPVYYE